MSKQGAFPTLTNEIDFYSDSGTKQRGSATTERASASVMAALACFSLGQATAGHRTNPNEIRTYNPKELGLSSWDENMVLRTTCRVELKDPERMATAYALFLTQPAQGVEETTYFVDEPAPIEVAPVDIRRRMAEERRAKLSQ